MGSLTPAITLVVLACLLGCGCAVAAAMLVRASRVRRRRLDAELSRSQAEVDALHERLDRLTAEMAEARREAEVERRHDQEHREYVITSLAVTGSPPEERVAPRASASQVLEDQLVDTLARQQGRSPVRTRAVDAVVRTVALGHGIRRALTPENLDRAAAEAHVARRRSRRTRRQEMREARRLVRAVRAHRTASATGRRAA